MSDATTESSRSPRLQPPERLSGVPEKPVVEISPQRPWLTLEETNRLIRQQGLSLAVAQAWVLDEVVSEIALPAAEEKQLIRNYVEQQKVSSDDELAAWLNANGSALRICVISPPRATPAALAATPLWRRSRTPLSGTQARSRSGGVLDPSGGQSGSR